MNRKKDKIKLAVLALLLAAMVWFSLRHEGEAQGQYWYLTTHYRWEWARGRWVRTVYPVVCSGYVCRPACHNYYGGWGPCRY